MLTARTNLTADQVRAELAGLEASYKTRSKTLKALLRALEAEEPTTAPGTASEPENSNGQES